MSSEEVLTRRDTVRCPTDQLDELASEDEGQEEPCLDNEVEPLRLELANLPMLIEALRHQDWEVRELAAEHISRFGPSAIRQLTEALAH
jgi:HEAT repeat protein